MVYLSGFDYVLKHFKLLLPLMDCIIHSFPNRHLRIITHVVAKQDISHAFIVIVIVIKDLFKPTRDGCLCECFSRSIHAEEGVRQSYMNIEVMCLEFAIN